MPKCSLQHQMESFDPKVTSNEPVVIQCQIELPESLGHVRLQKDDIFKTPGVKSSQIQIPISSHRVNKKEKSTYTIHQIDQSAPFLFSEARVRKTFSDT